MTLLKTYIYDSSPCVYSYYSSKFLRDTQLNSVCILEFPSLALLWGFVYSLTVTWWAMFSDYPWEVWSFFFKEKGELVDLVVRGDRGTREGGERGKWSGCNIWKKIKKNNSTSTHRQTVRNVKILIQSHKYSLHHTFKRMPLASRDSVVGRSLMSWEKSLGSS